MSLLFESVLLFLLEARHRALVSGSDELSRWTSGILLQAELHYLPPCVTCVRDVQCLVPSLTTPQPAGIVACGPLQHNWCHQFHRALCSFHIDCANHVCCSNKAHVVT